MRKQKNFFNIDREGPHIVCVPWFCWQGSCVHTGVLSQDSYGSEVCAFRQFFLDQVVEVSHLYLFLWL